MLHSPAMISLDPTWALKCPRIMYISPDGTEKMMLSIAPGKGILVYLTCCSGGCITVHKIFLVRWSLIHLPDTHLELQAFHCFPPNLHAANACYLSTSATPSPRCTVCPSLGALLPEVRTMLLSTSYIPQPKHLGS